MRYLRRFTDVLLNASTQSRGVKGHLSAVLTVYFSCIPTQLFVDLWPRDAFLSIPFCFSSTNRSAGDVAAKIRQLVINALRFQRHDEDVAHDGVRRCTETSSLDVCRRRPVPSPAPTSPPNPCPAGRSSRQQTAGSIVRRICRAERGGKIFRRVLDSVTANTIRHAYNERIWRRQTTSDGTEAQRTPSSGAAAARRSYLTLVPSNTPVYRSDFSVASRRRPSRARVP